MTAPGTPCLDLDKSVVLESWWDSEDRMEGTRQMISWKTGWRYDEKFQEILSILGSQEGVKGWSQYVNSSTSSEQQHKE